MGSIYVICSRQCPNGDGIYTLLYALYKYSTSTTNQPTKKYKSLNLRTHYGAINALRHHPFCPARQEKQVPSLAEHMEGEETREVDEQARSHQAAWHFTEEAHLASDKFAWH